MPGFQFCMDKAEPGTKISYRRQSSWCLGVSGVLKQGTQFSWGHGYFHTGGTETFLLVETWSCCWPHVLSVSNFLFASIHKQGRPPSQFPTSLRPGTDATNGFTKNGGTRKVEHWVRLSTYHQSLLVSIGQLHKQETHKVTEETRLLWDPTLDYLTL